MSGDRTLTLSRLIHAAPKAVWRCWTDPAVLPRWFGPDGYSCQTKEIDLREGGLWRFDMIAPDGTVFANRHRYQVMQPYSLIAFLMDDGDDQGAPMEVVVTLAPVGAGTQITQVITLPSAEARAHALSFGADRLGQQTLGKLAALAEAQPTLLP